MTSKPANWNPSENLVEEFHTPPGTPPVCPGGTATSVEPGNETSILGSSMEDNGSNNHKGNHQNIQNGKSKTTGSSSVTTLPGEKENVVPPVVVGGASGSSWVPADDQDEEMGIPSTGLGGESWNQNDAESDDQPEPVFWIADEPTVEAAEGQHSWMDQWKQVKTEATAAGLIQQEIEPKYLEKGAEDVQEGALVLSGEEEDEDGFVLIGDDLVTALSESYDLVGDSCKTKQQ